MLPASRGAAGCEVIREKVIPIAWLMTAAVIIGASIGFSARADATPLDDAYIETLDYFAVPYASEQQAITDGHEVCDLFDTGLNALGVINRMATAGRTQANAAHMTGAAVGAYCAEYGYLFDTTPGVLV